MFPSFSFRGATAAALALALALSAPYAVVGAQSVGTADVALFRIDPLGLDDERAIRLEALFRLELERLLGARMPSRTLVARAVGSDARLRGCTGDPECLSLLGQKLGVRQVISGNVGELGDSYVINLKLVDVATRSEVRRIEEPLRGSPDELIEAIRVAAYKLMIPEALRGQIAILADVPDGSVFLDERLVGKTPLERPLIDIPIGVHKLKIAAKGYTTFEQAVEVRFQKTTQVVVRMVAAPRPHSAAFPSPPPRPANKRRKAAPWYTSNWGYVAAGAGAVVMGVVLGLLLSGDEVVRCDEEPGKCGL